MSDKQKEQFIYDRTKEILFFIEQSYTDHKDKCSTSDWNKVLDNVTQALVAVPHHV